MIGNFCQKSMMTPRICELPGEAYKLLLREACLVCAASKTWLRGSECTS